MNTDNKQDEKQFVIHGVSNCAFMVYVENAGRLIVIAKDKSEVESKMKAEGFKNSFKILESFSFIA